MTDLLSRLSALTGPSREVETEIALTNGWQSPSVDDRISFYSDGRNCWRGPAGETRFEPPRYTESIDAAMTLLGNRPCVLKIKNANGKAEARVGGLPGEGFVIKEGEHEFPAIALVIACLKA